MSRQVHSKQEWLRASIAALSALAAAATFGVVVASSFSLTHDDELHRPVQNPFEHTGAAR